MRLADLPPHARKLAKFELLKTPRRRKSEAEKALDRANARKAREAFFGALRRAGLPIPDHEFRFHGVRRWRFDYSWPGQKLALEVDGGLYVQGRHSRGAGAEADHEKLNHAAALGWRVLRTTPRKLTKPTTIALIRLALEHQP